MADNGLEIVQLSEGLGVELRNGDFELLAKDRAFFHLVEDLLDKHLLVLGCKPNHPLEIGSIG